MVHLYEDCGASTPGAHLVRVATLHYYEDCGACALSALMQKGLKSTKDFVGGRGEERRRRPATAACHRWS